MRTVVLPALLLACSGVAQAQVVVDPSLSWSVEVANLRNPQDVAVDAQGRVYVSDSGNGRILRGGGAGGLAYSPIIDNIPVAPFFGTDLGPMGLAISNDRLLWGEAGRPTGVEQVYQTTLDGAPVRAFPGIALGGNWSGLHVDSSSGRLFASSANGDVIFAANPSGNTWTDFSPFIETGLQNLISPVGSASVGNTLYVLFYGRFGTEGYLSSFDLTTGALINANLAINLLAPTSIELAPDGRLLITELGFDEADGKLTAFDPASGTLSTLVEGLQKPAGVGVGADGTIYVSEIGQFNTTQGRVIKIVPAPGAVGVLAGLGLLAARRRR